MARLLLATNLTAGGRAAVNNWNLFSAPQKKKEKNEKSSAQQQQVHINRQRSMIAIMNSLDS